MDIILFDDLTTEDVISALEAESKEYTGLYVDMDKKEQRKYVKDKAQTINDLLKKLDRARIDKKKRYSQQIEVEATEIKQRLEGANKPFTLLIDEHKAKRAKILADEKARVEAIELASRLEADHEFGLLLNKQFDAEKHIREQQRQDEIRRIEEAASQRAIEQQKALQAAQEQEKINAENARLADTEHKAKVNRKALADLMELGLTEDDAKSVIVSIARKLISHVTINY
ncbi:hypothetical protein [Pseudoalteromonas sp.]|uniref:hypothetical protein n=1 Tax=Pseudoalteromonas sp. TaxID=53249 RepID=UPI003563ADED